MFFIDFCIKFNDVYMKNHAILINFEPIFVKIAPKSINFAFILMNFAYIFVEYSPHGLVFCIIQNLYNTFRFVFYNLDHNWIERNVEIMSRPN